LNLIYILSLNEVGGLRGLAPLPITLNEVGGLRGLEPAKLAPTWAPKEP